MLKIEQGRLNWGSDFTELANKFLDKKVRMNLMSSSNRRGKSPNYRPSSNGASIMGDFNHGPRSHFNFDKNSSNSSHGHNNNFRNNKSFSSSISVICRLWNSGHCSFGANCKRWHVCLSCAEEGKLGEPHMASEHEESSACRTSYEQPV